MPISALMTVGFCGLCYGVYMVLMNRSGVPGAITYFVLSAITLIASVIFLLSQKVNWAMDATQVRLVVGASLINGVAGAVFFNYLAKAPRDQVGFAIVVMVVVQFTAAVILAAWLTKTPLNAYNVAGIVCAAAAMVLINK